MTPEILEKTNFSVNKTRETVNFDSCPHGTDSIFDGWPRALLQEFTVLTVYVNVYTSIVPTEIEKT
jgi:hypothetical protein